MNKTEIFIARFYQSVNIIDPLELSIVNVSERINLSVIYWELGSAFSEHNGENKMFINKYLNTQQRWQDFGHEMKHYFFDTGNPLYLNTDYVEFQELKADYFSYHFCVPTFMLQELKGVSIYEVMNRFNVEFDFALKRLEMYKNKLYARGINCGELSKKREHLAIRC